MDIKGELQTKIDLTVNFFVKKASSLLNSNFLGFFVGEIWDRNPSPLAYKRRLTPLHKLYVRQKEPEPARHHGDKCRLH